MLLRQLLEVRKVLDRDISHDFCLMYYKPEQGVERTYFRLYYLSIKLEKLLDIAAYEREMVKNVLVFPNSLSSLLNIFISGTVLILWDAIYNKTIINHFKIQFSSMICEKYFKKFS